jgi:HlyD family secretion protein
MKFSDMKLKIFFLAAFNITLLAGCNKQNENIRPTVKPLIEAVYASGFVVSEDEYEIVAQVEGYVAEKLVVDGAEIKKGDPIYIINSEQQTSRSRMARETYELASKNFRDDSPVLSELKAALDASKTKMLFDSTNYVRYQNLIKSNATSQAEFDRVRLAYENSSNEFTLQKSRYEKTKNQLKLEYENAKNNLDINTNESGRYIIRSEVNGRVFLTAKEKGELIRRSEVIAVVGKNKSYYLQLNVDELDIQRVKPGQEAIIKIDAYPEKTFRATISRVYPIVDRRLQSVRADAELKDALPGPFSGLALEANIIINQKDKALVIPKSSLLPGDSVMIETDDGSKKIKVTKGIETLDEVEIVEGLDTGKLLVIR